VRPAGPSVPVFASTSSFRFPLQSSRTTSNSLSRSLNFHSTSRANRFTSEVGHLQDNPARGVDLPKLRTVRPKLALTREQAAALLEALPALSRAMAGLAILSGLRRGELFALRWQDIDEESRVLTVREAVYDGAHGTRERRHDAERVHAGA